MIVDTCVCRTYGDSASLLKEQCPLYRSSREMEMVYLWARAAGNLDLLREVTVASLRIMFVDYRACGYFVSVLIEDTGSLSKRLWEFCERRGWCYSRRIPRLKLVPCCAHEETIHEGDQECPTHSFSPAQDTPVEVCMIFGTLSQSSSHCKHYTIFPSPEPPRLASSSLGETHHPPSEHVRILRVQVYATDSPFIQSDLAWSKRICTLVTKHSYLISLSIINTTMGGAYACLKDARKAAYFASRQLRVAISLGDVPMEIRSMFHLSYWFIYKRDFKVAQDIISSQTARAKNLDSRVLLVMGNAAQIALDHAKKSLETVEEIR